MEDKKYRIIEIKENIFADNNKDADVLRAELKKRGTFFLNIMSSPGSGKTTTLTQIIPRLADKYKIGVMEADIDSDVDAATITSIGAKAIQLHTGGMCHLTAEMTRQGIEGIGDEDFDFLILENVGNLVCPAEFDTGSVKNLTILSVPEGDDKPLKYPLMYQVSDLLVINKIDVAPYFTFDIEKCKANAKMRNPDIDIIPISAKTGEGVDELVASVAEGEAAGGQAVSACRSGKGLLGVGRRVGREARIRPDQRGTEELRRAFGADVYAEIKQGRGIALGHRRHGEKVAAVCIELHKEPRSVVEMGAPPPGRMGIPFFSADSAARIQAAQSSGLVVSTAIWLGRGR